MRIYTYNINTNQIEFVSTLDATVEYTNENYVDLEYDEQPFLDWEDQGGVLMHENGTIVHYPPA